MKKSILFLLLLGIGMHAFSQKDEIRMQHYRQEWKSLKQFMSEYADRSIDTTYDVLFYHLDLSVEVENPYIDGNVLVKAKATQDGVDQVKLDLNRSLDISTIALNSSGYSFENDRITVYLDKTYNEGEAFELRIYYSGVPVEAGGYKGLRYETHFIDEPVIATLSTPFLAHYWYPCKDGPLDKADSVYVDITIPDTSYNGIPLKAVSNGVLDTIIDLGESRQFKWKHRYPIVTYYVMLAISNWSEINQVYANDSLSFPLDYYVFDEFYEEAEESLQDFPGVFDVFHEKFGIYPFYEEKYGMTQLGFYGAIENQTNTIIGYMADNWFMIYVHELGHMWFGDMITCKSWHHGWLNEGFATYSEAIYIEGVDGFEAYLDEMDNNEYFEAGSLYLDDLDTFQVFHPIIYSKGAYVLHMLRGVLGDEDFFDAIKTYANTPDFMFANVTTEDFQEVCEEVSGEDLHYFFDQWIYDERYPIYRYNIDISSNTTEVSLYQSQGESQGWRDVFEMPVRIKFQFTDDTDTTLSVWNDQQFQAYGFQFDKEVEWVYIDPQKWILRKVYYDPDLPLGMEEREKLAFRVYPNPAKTAFNVDLPIPLKEEAYFIIFNPVGKQVYRENLPEETSRFHIDAASLSPGIYMLKVFSGSEIQSRKLLIQ